MSGNQTQNIQTNMNKNQQQQQNNNQNNPPAPVEIAPAKSKLDLAIEFVGKNFTTVREWQGANGRVNATVGLRQASVPAPYTNISEIVQKVLDSCREIRTNTGHNTYAQYKLRYANKTAIGRLLSISKDGKYVTLSLEIEHNITGAAGSGIMSFQPKTEKPDEQQVQAQAVDDTPDLGGF